MWNPEQKSTRHYPLIRTVYLYLFTIVGLTLLVIGGVRFVDMGLKAFIFTQAEQRIRINAEQPPMPYQLERIEKYQGGEISLSESERNAIGQWLTEYEAWKEQSAKLDPVTSRRHEQAAGNLAAILIGLPLYLYHWGLIRKESGRREEK